MVERTLKIEVPGHVGVGVHHPLGETDLKIRPDLRGAVYLATSGYARLGVEKRDRREPALFTLIPARDRQRALVERPVVGGPRNRESYRHAHGIGRKLEALRQHAVDGRLRGSEVDHLRLRVPVPRRGHREVRRERGHGLYLVEWYCHAASQGCLKLSQNYVIDRQLPFDKLRANVFF